MDVLGLLISLLSALLPAGLGALRDYHIVGLLKNWTEAQSYCKENFFELATIEDAAEWAKLQPLVALAGHDQAWIGLYDDIYSWRWSLDDKLLYKNGTIELGSWFNFLIIPNQLCALFYIGRLQTAPCYFGRNFICYNEPNNSYIHVSQSLSWTAAQSYCRSMYTDLAMIRNQQDWNTLVSGTNWVGLSKESWKWSDQTDSSYRAWRQGLPSDPCGTALADGWSGATCDMKLPFICSAPRKRVLKLKMKVAGPADLNDPLIQVAILKEIERQLQQQGLQQQLQLRWRQQPDGNVFNKTTL